MEMTQHLQSAQSGTSAKGHRILRILLLENVAFSSPIGQNLILIEGKEKTAMRTDIANPTFGRIQYLGP